MRWTAAFLSWLLEAALAPAEEIRVYLIDAALHEPDPDADAVLADIPAEARLAAGTVAAYSIDGGLLSYEPFDPARGTGYPDPGGGRAGRVLAHVLWSGDEATSRILGYDTLPEPHTLDGTPDRLEWPHGVARLRPA